MNVIKTYNKLKEIALSNEMVNFVSFNDILYNWKRKDIKYGAINFSIESVENIVGGQKYRILLHYGDRLLKEGNNDNYIFNDTVVVIKDIINKLSNLGETIDIDSDYNIQFFEYQFNDYLAGGTVYFNWTVEDEIGDCGGEEYETRTLNIAKNGEYYVFGYDKVFVGVPPEVIVGKSKTIPSGISLPHLMFNTESINNITEIDDPESGWTYDTGNLNKICVPANLQKCTLKCKKITGSATIGGTSYANLEELNFPELEQLGPITGSHGQILIAGAPKITELNFPKLKSIPIQGGRYGICIGDSNSTCLINCKKINMPELTDFSMTNGSLAIIHGLPKLEEVYAPNSHTTYCYSNRPFLMNVPNLRKLVIGDWYYNQWYNNTDLIFGEPRYNRTALMPNFIHLEICANGTTYKCPSSYNNNLSFNQWAPTMAVREDVDAADYIDLREDKELFSTNLEQFLYNFKTYIVDRLGENKTNFVWYLRLTSTVFDTIWDLEGNPLDKDICREIDTELSNKNWTIVKV